MRAHKLERELPEIVRAAESFDYRKSERKCLDESFAQIVAIDAEPRAGAHPVVANVSLDRVRLREHRRHELELQLTQPGHDASPAGDQPCALRQRAHRAPGYPSPTRSAWALARSAR